MVLIAGISCLPVSTSKRLNKLEAASCPGRWDMACCWRFWIRYWLVCQTCSAWWYLLNLRGVYVDWQFSRFALLNSSMLVSNSCFILKLTSVILPLQQLDSKGWNESVSGKLVELKVVQNADRAPDAADFSTVSLLLLPPHFLRCSFVVFVIIQLKHGRKAVLNWNTDLLLVQSWKSTRCN